MSPLTWDEVVECGFRQLEGAPEGVLIYRFSDDLEIVLWPEYTEHRLGRGRWVVRNFGLPAVLCPRTKAELEVLMAYVGREARPVGPSVTFGELMVGDRFMYADGALWAVTEPAARDGSNDGVGRRITVTTHGHLGDSLASFGRDEVVQFVPPVLPVKQKESSDGR